MRRFLLLAHKAPSSGEFTLNDLAGGGGRIDEVARSVSTAFTLSNDLRRDTEMTILFRGPDPPGPRRVHLIGARLKFLNPDERSTAALVKNALVRALGAPHEIESSPGLVVGAAEPLTELRRFVAQPGALWLTETGKPLRSWAAPPEGFAAVLCDPFDPAEDERVVLEASGIPAISLGPRSLRSSQCIDVLHNEFDLRQSGVAGGPPGA
jgi:tRNA (pseudouridine54-N1)-methyltransferase